MWTARQAHLRSSAQPRCKRGMHGRPAAKHKTIFMQPANDAKASDPAVPPQTCSNSTEPASPTQLTFQTFAQVGTVKNFMSFTVIILG